MVKSGTNIKTTSNSALNNNQNKPNDIANNKTDKYKKNPIRFTKKKNK